MKWDNTPADILLKDKSDDYRRGYVDGLLSAADLAKSPGLQKLGMLEDVLDSAARNLDRYRREKKDEEHAKQTDTTEGSVKPPDRSIYSGVRSNYYD